MGTAKTGTRNRRVRKTGIRKTTSGMRMNTNVQEDDDSNNDVDEDEEDEEGGDPAQAPSVV